MKKQKKNFKKINLILSEEITYEVVKEDDLKENLIWILESLAKNK